MVSALGDPGINLIGSEAEQAAGIAQMARVINCSAAPGAHVLAGPLHSTLGHFSGSGPMAEEIARFVAAQREASDLAAAKGVTIAHEALNRFECYLDGTIQALSDHVDAIGHRAIRAMCETFHANIMEADSVAAFSRHRRNTVHVHISENDRGVPGWGNNSWAETFRVIRASAYDDWLTIESSGRDFADSPEAVYRDGFAHIRRGWGAEG